MLIGYERAKTLMKQHDWKMLVTMDEEDILSIRRIKLYHPNQQENHIVRRDSGKRLMEECRVIGPKDHLTAILCYNHAASDETLI